MEKSNRTKNSLINGTVSSITQVIDNLINFIVRTIFIYYLSSEYLGLNGLFSNILTILNFAELGFGNAIIYHLYKPVAENNIERIKLLVKFYKKIYKVIGVVILTLGIMLIPFLKYIVGDVTTVKENINILYVMFLLQTLGTYFYGYKRTVFMAYQKDYVNVLIDFGVNVLKYILQIIILILTRNYMLYLAIYVITTIISNIIISVKADIQYPFLKDKTVKNISNSERKKIFNDVKSLVMYKLGSTIQKGTDNILLTILVSLEAVGIYSNYSIIINTVSGGIWSILDGMSGSIGNLNNQASNEKKEEILLQINFISSYLSGIAFICICNLINPFITLWIGNEYLFSMQTVIIITSCIYFKCIEYPMTAYRNTLGLFKEGRMTPLISAIINMILSIILGKLYGIVGIFVATLIAMITTTIWYNPYILYKKKLNKSPRKYYANGIYYVCCIIITLLVCYNVNKLITQTSMIWFILRCMIVFILSNVIFIALVWRKEEFKGVKEKIINLIKSNLGLVQVNS